MPLPLLFIAAAAVTGVVGAGKTVKAGIDSSEAKSTNRRANEMVEEATKRIENARKKCGTSLENLGAVKINILDKSINRFVESFEKFKNINLSESKGLNELGNIKLDKKEFEDLKEMGGFASSMLKGSASGIAAGALTAFGAYSAAGAFATASTGTAIASLSGAAATNATLAFFGGGSLAAGGLGVAGGAAVLGGIVAGPALLVTGFITGSKASAKLDEAYANKAKATQICEELDAGTDQCNSIRRRAYMLYNLLVRLDSYFVPLIMNMEDIIKKEGTDFTALSASSKKSIAAALSAAGSVKAVLDTTILTEDGKLTAESKDIYDITDRQLSDNLGW